MAKTILADNLDTVLRMATRAPSVHNTQPWRFRYADGVLDLHADPTRQLRATDPDGREMLISCGAVLFGVRLVIRQLGYLPSVELLPAGAGSHLLARVRAAGAAPLAVGEQRLLAGLRRRHTHRGPFAAQPLPDGLLALLRRDAEAEGATLVLIDGPGLEQLADLVAAGDRRQSGWPTLASELLAWTRPRHSASRDGVPARAYPARPPRLPGRLVQRDFDLGLGQGSLDHDAGAGDGRVRLDHDGTGCAPTGTGQPGALGPATAVLTTRADDPAAWLQAGQALHRLLLRAAAGWVFATMHTQPLEVADIRAALRTRLSLPGAAQMVLQLGRAAVAPLTPRRPATDLIDL
jgi:hypothetical protein